MRNTFVAYCIVCHKRTKHTRKAHYTNVHYATVGGIMERDYTLITCTVCKSFNREA